jgi:NADPH-dependent 2,4-dienoyl-CoA reductase/sulfur reductase-like enzyme
MHEVTCDVAIIGGGPAGLSAAIGAKEEGAARVSIIERDANLGGILRQCIHPGFGLAYFKEALTGPEYAGRLTDRALHLCVEAMPNSMVLELRPSTNEILCVNAKTGLTKVTAKSIVLAMGCRERTRANLQIPGSRPSGIYTAGAAQRLINVQNAMVGNHAMILGSGDIGMIMARRMTLEGAKVSAVAEIMDYTAGLTRNKVQCLDDFNIPLKLRCTVTRIVGDKRIEGVHIAQVDAQRKPMLETEAFFPCDTLLLSVGLLPENELTRDAGITMSEITGGPVVNGFMQTSAPPVFACGNVVHVNDLVDNVTAESMLAGKYAARYAKGQLKRPELEMCAIPGRNVRYLCPQKLAFERTKEAQGKALLFFRVTAPEQNVNIVVSCNGKIIVSRKVQRVSPGEICSIEFNCDNIESDITVDVIKQEAS